MHRILVVDDDPHIREVICFALERAGMAAEVARNGAEALARLGKSAPGLVILDVGMPEMDGLEVCRNLRKTKDVPILFLSARDEEIDRVLGLEMGGDDYVTKPFGARELVARVNVILRRTRPVVPEPVAEMPLSHGALRLDASRHLARFGQHDLALTAREFAIVKALLARPGFVITREQLMNAAYGSHLHVSDRTIDSHVRNIRAKFLACGCANSVETVHGIGFRIGLCAAEP